MNWLEEICKEKGINVPNHLQHIIDTNIEITKINAYEVYEIIQLGVDFDLIYKKHLYVKEPGK